jgi:hypothetical protein
MLSLSMREFKIVATATIVGLSAIALVQLLAAGVAALPLAWLLGTSQLGLALAKIGPYILINFLAMLLSMWVYLRVSHLGRTPAAEPARPVAAAEATRASVSYEG